MKLTDREIELAARALQKMRERQALKERINDPSLTPEERDLVMKYPRHTLEAAKYIDSCECGEASVGKGHEDAFWKLRMQETHNLRPGYDT